LFSLGASPAGGKAAWRSPRTRARKIMRTFPSYTADTDSRNVSPPSSFKAMPAKDPPTQPDAAGASGETGPPVPSKQEEASQRAEVYRELGNQAYKNALYAEALQHYTRSIEISPATPSYYGNRAACFWMLKRYAQCRDDSLKATQLDPTYYKGFARAGRTFLHLGQLREAREQLSRAKILNPAVPLDSDFRTLREAEALLEDYEGKMRSEDFHRALQKAKALISLLAEAPRFKVMAMHAFAYIKPTFVLKEIRSLKSTIPADDADNLRYLFYVEALAHFYQNFCEEAIVLLDTAIQNGHGDDSMCALMSQIEQFEADKQAANAAFQARHYTAAHDQYSRLLLSALLKHNRMVLAIIRCNRAAAAKELGRLRDALLDCSIAIDLNGTYVRAYVRRARIYIQLGDAQAAMRDFQQAQSLEHTISVQQEMAELKQSIQRRVEAEYARERARQKQAADAAAKAASKVADHYTTLGIERAATTDEVKKAYRSLALQHHPDKAAEAERPEAERRFKEISEAYGTLSDEQKRREYDLKSRRSYGAFYGDRWSQEAWQDTGETPFQRQYHRRWG